MNARNLALAILVLILASLMLPRYTQIASAQADTCGAVDGAWDVESSATAASRTWYAVKFNRCTGEAWVLSAEGSAADDKWLILPNEKVGATR